MIQLVADKQNPAQFFGACGFLELANWLRPGTTSVWTDDCLEIHADSSVFGEILDMIGRFQAVMADWHGKSNVNPIDLIDKNTKFCMRLDWWQSRACSETNSIWKCFAANMTPINKTIDMLNICRDCAPNTTPENIFLSMSRNATGRLGFDPRSSWNAIDTGTSINEWKDKSVATYGFCEFLTSLAAQTFPINVSNSNKQGFYYAWEKPYSIILVRMAVVGMIPECGILYRFDRKMRGQGFPSFSYSTKISSNLST